MSKAIALFILMLVSSSRSLAQTVPDKTGPAVEEATPAPNLAVSIELPPEPGWDLIPEDNRLVNLEAEASIEVLPVQIDSAEKVTTLSMATEARTDLQKMGCTASAIKTSPDGHRFSFTYTRTGESRSTGNHTKVARAGQVVFLDYVQAPGIVVSVFGDWPAASANRLEFVTDWVISTVTLTRGVAQPPTEAPTAPSP